MSRTRALVLLAAALGGAATAAVPEMVLVKPGNTGIPGEEVRLVRFAPDGTLWVGARWPFWGEGGFGVYDRARDLWTVHSNVDGPLPTPLVNDIVFAPDGTVWIATDAGLVRKHGADWTVYSTANAPLLHDGIADVERAPDGTIWVNNTRPATTDAAILSFDGATWTRYEVGGALPWALPWKQLSSLLVTADGHVWVANEVLNGVAEYDGVTWTLHGADVDRFAALTADLAGNVWTMGGVGGANAFYRFDGTSFAKHSIGTTPTAIGVDDDGTIFLGDWGGTIRRSTDGGQSFGIFATGLDHVFHIAPAPDSTDVWVGTPGAVGRFGATGALLDDFNTYNTGAPDHFVDRFDVDAQGNLWQATGEGGLSRFDGVRWRNWGDHNLGAEPYPFAGNEPMGAFHLDRDGVGWMGGNGIARWNPTTGGFDGFWNWQNNPGIGVTLFEGFAEDAAGRLFAVTDTGAVYRFDGAQQLWIRESVNVYAPFGVGGIETDSAGDVLVAGWFALHRWDGAQWSQVALDVDLFALGGVNAMAIGPDDAIWLGTNGGLVRHHEGASTLFDPSTSPMPVADVQGIDVRADGVIGLALSHFQSLKPFPHAVAIVAGDFTDPAAWTTWQHGSSPLPHDQLGAVRFDADGNLWISAVSEGAAVILNPAQPLAVDGTSISLTDGGAIDFALDAGPAAAGRPYALLTSASGAAPGIPVPGGVLPIQWDVVTETALLLANTPTFVGFLGTLDAQGRAAATFDTLGPLHEPVLAGHTLTFAYGVGPSLGSPSNAVRVVLLP